MGWHWGILASSGGGAAGAYDLLETTVLSSAASSVTFSSLGSYSDYKHLQIRAAVRKVDSGTLSRIQLNSDTGSNYARHRLQGNGSIVSSSATTTQTSMDFPLMPDDGMTSNVFGGAVIDILDFSSSNKNTTLRSFGGYAEGGSNAISLNSGFWNNTAAVTSITFFFTTGNIVAGSRFSLYGVK